MNKKLKSAVFYSEDRVSISDLDLENYVTTDNLLQNKQGKTKAVNLPPQDGNVTRFDTEDILIANIRPYLKKIWSANHPGGNSADVLTLKVNNKYEPKFIYYALHRDVFFEHVMNGSKGTKMPRGDKDQILEFPIPDFEKPVQKKIAKVLSDLDSKIELNNKINEELEAMAKLIYDYWFVQSDFPITKEQAEALGNPKLEGKPYKSSGCEMVYNEELKREIPEGWVVGTILDCADLVGGGTPSKKKKEYWGGTIPFFTPSDSEDYVFCFSSELYTNDLGVRKSSTKYFDKGTVFITARGSVGRINIAGVPMAMNQSCYALCPKKSYSSEFIYFHTEQIVEILKIKSSGSTFNSIVTNDFKFSKLVVPDKKVIQSYSSLVESFFKKIWLNKNETQKLTELRDWLLPMLMNGQVSVGEAEAELSKAAEPEVEYKGEQQANITPLFPPKEDRHFLKRKMLACYIINQSLEDQNFGDTKFEKLLHLCDYWAIQRNFQQKYYQKAAGPYDNAFTKQFFQQVLKAKWYKKIPNGAMNRIVAGVNQEKSTNTYGYFTEEELAKVDQLIKYFRRYTYEQPEIISTLYAVWNNRLILGQNISDVLLKQDFLDWDEQKIRYKDRLNGALQWMREEGLVPDGWGKLIEKPKKR